MFNGKYFPFDKRTKRDARRILMETFSRLTVEAINFLKELIEITEGQGFSRLILSEEGEGENKAYLVYPLEETKIGQYIRTPKFKEFFPEDVFGQHGTFLLEQKTYELMVLFYLDEEIYRLISALFPGVILIDEQDGSSRVKFTTHLLSTVQGLKDFVPQQQEKDQLARKKRMLIFLRVYYFMRMLSELRPREVSASDYLSFLGQACDTTAHGLLIVPSEIARVLWAAGSPPFLQPNPEGGNTVVFLTPDAIRDCEREFSANRYLLVLRRLLSVNRRREVSFEVVEDKLYLSVSANVSGRFAFLDSNVTPLEREGRRLFCVDDLSGAFNLLVQFCHQFYDILNEWMGCLYPNIEKPCLKVVQEEQGKDVLRIPFASVDRLLPLPQWGQEMSQLDNPPGSYDWRVDNFSKPSILISLILYVDRLRSLATARTLVTAKLNPEIVENFLSDALTPQLLSVSSEIGSLQLPAHIALIHFALSELTACWLASALILEDTLDESLRVKRLEQLACLCEFVGPIDENNTLIFLYQTLIFTYSELFKLAVSKEFYPLDKLDRQLALTQQKRAKLENLQHHDPEIQWQIKLATFRLDLLFFWLERAKANLQNENMEDFLSPERQTTFFRLLDNATFMLNYFRTPYFFQDASYFDALLLFPLFDAMQVFFEGVSKKNLLPFYSDYERRGLDTLALNQKIVDLFSILANLADYQQRALEFYQVWLTRLVFTFNLPLQVNMSEALFLMACPISSKINEMAAGTLNPEIGIVIASIKATFRVLQFFVQLEILEDLFEKIEHPLVDAEMSKQLLEALLLDEQAISAPLFSALLLEALKKRNVILFLKNSPAFQAVLTRKIESGFAFHHQFLKFCSSQPDKFPLVNQRVLARLSQLAKHFVRSFHDVYVEPNCPIKLSLNERNQCLEIECKSGQEVESKRLLPRLAIFLKIGRELVKKKGKTSEKYCVMYHDIPDNFHEEINLIQRQLQQRAKYETVFERVKTLENAVNDLTRKMKKLKQGEELTADKTNLKKAIEQLKNLKKALDNLLKCIEEREIECHQLFGFIPFSGLFQQEEVVSTEHFRKLQVAAGNLKEAYGLLNLSDLTEQITEVEQIKVAAESFLVKFSQKQAVFPSAAEAPPLKVQNKVSSDKTDAAHVGAGVTAPLSTHDIKYYRQPRIEARIRGPITPEDKALRRAYMACMREKAKVSQFNDNHSSLSEEPNVAKKGPGARH